MSSSPVYASGPGKGGGSWFWWLVRNVFLLGCGLVVVLLVLCMGVVKKRITQYQRGDFLGFGDFLGYLVGDIQVKLQQLLGSGGGGSLPSNMGAMGMGGGMRMGNLPHEHSV